MLAVEWLERAEHDAWEDLYRACPAPVAGRLGLGVERMDGALYLQARAIPLTQFNRLSGLGLAADESAIDFALHRFREAGITQAWCQVAPGPLQARAEAHLARTGLRLHERRWVKFWRPAAAPPSVATALTIVPVDRASADQFADAVLAGFGMPPMLKPWLAALPGRAGWHCFMALARDAAVAGAALHVVDGIGWLGIGATRPEHRQKGAQSALLAARLEAGLARGVEGFTTETGRPLPGEPGSSFANIKCAGFRIAYDRPNWTI
jgi:hypothetical protein